MPKIQPLVIKHFAGMKPNLTFLCSYLNFYLLSEKWASNPLSFLRLRHLKPILPHSVNFKRKSQILIPNWLIDANFASLDANSAPFDAKFGVTSKIWVHFHVLRLKLSHDINFCTLKAKFTNLMACVRICVTFTSQLRQLTHDYIFRFQILSSVKHNNFINFEAFTANLWPKLCILTQKLRHLTQNFASNLKFNSIFVFSVQNYL